MLIRPELSLHLVNGGPGQAGSSLANGLVHYYKMEEATGNGARVDQLGAGNWTAAGSPTQAPGKSGFGVGVQVGKYLQMSTPSLLTTTFTLAFWMNASSYTELFGNPVPILVASTGSRGFDLTRGDGIGGTRVQLVVYSGGASVTKAGDPLSTGVSHGVVIWATPTTFGFQIDGGSDSTGSTTFSVAGNNMTLGFSTSTSVVGTFDEMAVWNRVLSASERAEWYAAGAGKFYPY